MSPGATCPRDSRLWLLLGRTLYLIKSLEASNEQRIKSVLVEPEFHKPLLFLSTLLT